MADDNFINKAKKAFFDWGYRQQSGQTGHTGSWGTKEYGVSELLKNIFSKPAYAAENTTSQPVQYGPYLNEILNQPSNNNGQVNGASTYSGGGSPSPIQNQPQQQPQNQPQAPSQPSWEDIMRGQIESGYNDYFGQLDQMMNSLPGQRQGQEQIVQNQYQQGLNTLTGQRDIGQKLLGTQRTKTETAQAKNLRDLSENIRNMFTTGNVMLGQKGAGDSSAADMYSYAVTKLGSKQRTDITNKTSEIMNEINDREFKLNTTYNTEQKNLASERDNKILQISQWFADAQNQIRQMIASGQLNKSKDIQNLTQNLLNSAMQEMANTKAAYENRRSALEQWAMNHAENINQLKQNMASISQYNAQPMPFTPITGQPQWSAGGNLVAPYGFGSTSEEDKKRPLF